MNYRISSCLYSHVPALLINKLFIRGKNAPGSETWKFVIVGEEVKKEHRTSAIWNSSG